MDKVKQELSCMEGLGVICRVEEPTDWCAGIVVVPKKTGAVRICVDLTKLNEMVTKVTEGLEGMVCHIDDVLVWGCTMMLACMLHWRKSRRQASP
ncbi:hypothetical protein NFI96_030638 [Prochilodus magdalenae]|nr:hypothetical protein NFI96_030638 [Prochilodus magdalenae]